tara:strand:+ start:278 stop:439 length:162 start_codon:yes stop_codon:yes gene_type:complete
MNGNSEIAFCIGAAIGIAVAVVALPATLSWSIRWLLAPIMSGRLAMSIANSNK